MGELKDAINLAKKAGNQILKIYQGNYRVQEKEDKSFLTEADLLSEKIILEGLKKYDYGILSEETKDNLSRLSQKRIWIVDPLDGTQDFLKKTGDFSIMIGLVEKGEPVLGVVYKPVGEKLYFAEKGKGAYLKEGKNPAKKLKVSEISELTNSRFAVSRFHLIESERKFLKENKIFQVRYVGSIGIKLGMIAEGKIEGYVNLSKKTFQWDTCAPEIILREAGGEITDFQGRKLLYNRKETRNLKGVVASNGKIHSQILQSLNHLTN